ncbi:DUF3383 family protein [Pararhizobium sp.]|uniref:DUF3383 family protein n=1 Tax=Pararhizobium sp. TaxID=1977563 RepID=UPI0027264CFE|nr:DUF3383 family protein [Pararhizobium sp.]MDO9417034.1 DUF3383 family protein [Pararhizobium sp.]
MATIPYSRVVNVTMTRKDRFVSRRGFGTQLIVTTASVNGKVDAAHRTKLYATIEEVAADWATTSSVYKAANTAFSRPVRPTQIKVGHIVDDATMTSAELQAQMDLLAAADNDWYFLTVTDELRDIAATVGFLVWTESKRKLALIDSNNDDTEDPTSTTSSIASANKGLYERTAIFYHPVVDYYLSASAAAYFATRNFDDADSGYTGKFKGAPTIPAANIASAALTAVTGFTPGLGQSTTAGHLANTIIDIGGQAFIVEGSVLKANVFIDTIHATDWIVSRTEEEILNIFLNNAKIFYTPIGMNMIASAIRMVMQQGVRAGIVDRDVDINGEYSPAVEITIPNVYTDVTASQRASRIAPAIACRFRYAGSVHYATVNYSMEF